MLELPWQIIAALLGLVGLQQVLSHFKHSDCDERIREAKTQEHRDTMRIYREGFETGRKDGCNHERHHKQGREE